MRSGKISDKTVWATSLGSYPVQVADNKYLKIIYTVSDENVGSWAGERRRINKAMVTKYLSGDEMANAIFYICGPPSMLKAMQELLQELDVPEDRIKTEEFTGY